MGQDPQDAMNGRPGVARRIALFPLTLLRLIGKSILMVLVDIFVVIIEMRSQRYVEREKLRVAVGRWYEQKTSRKA